MAGSPIFRMFHMGNLLGGQKKRGARRCSIRKCAKLGAVLLQYIL
jgi:hypothetical protein